MNALGRSDDAMLQMVGWDGNESKFSLPASYATGSRENDEIPQVAHGELNPFSALN